ncbi:hypothetical protein Trydic_g2769 [Trypoxylus dichotomus]
MPLPLHRSIIRPSDNRDVPVEITTTILDSFRNERAAVPSVVGRFHLYGPFYPSIIFHRRNGFSRAAESCRRDLSSCALKLRNAWSTGESRAPCNADGEYRRQKTNVTASTDYA